ncbi:MAG: hypothetical protein HWN65_17730 [Candidatus Helarchaeota archaeon]|nr:hypothetical protein [Candidatus Helarchaeota archaeon]
MAVGKIRAAIIIVLFTTSAFIPILMETAIVPMMNLLNFISNFVEVKYDALGEPEELEFKWDALLSSIQDIKCLHGESTENHTVFEITMNVSNTDPFQFDLLIPGLDITIFWKAGMPYSLEKETVLGWKYDNFSDPNPHKEPDYGTNRRWTRVIGIESDPLRVSTTDEPKDWKIKFYLYNDQTYEGQSSALGQMIGTILRTGSTKDPYTNDTLMHLSGSVSLDILGFNFPLSMGLGIDLSGFLNFTDLLGGLGGDGGGGNGGPSLFDLLFEVPLSIYDIQNYNDSNPGPFGGPFVRDYSGIDNQTGLKIWTEELFQHGALSAYVMMDFMDDLGVHGLNITLMQSSHNPDAADANLTWNPYGADINREFIKNQIFLYLPDMPSLRNPDWADRIFGLLGFASDQEIFDYHPDSPELKEGDLGDGRILAGGTLRLTGDLRPNSNFTVGDGLGALLTQAVDGILPIGVFGSIDLKLNDMPLSICLDVPLEVNISSLMSGLTGGGDGGGEEEGGDVFSMLMDYIGFNQLFINGLAFDTFNSILQLNFSADMDTFMPFGIYMPSNVSYDVQGDPIPYLGIGGGPLQIFDDKYPEDWDNMSATEQRDWHHQHLVVNFTTFDGKTFKQSMADLMATIGSTDKGDGIAYLFRETRDDDVPHDGHGYIPDFVDKYTELPNPEDDYSNFKFTEDQFKIDFTENAPDFGLGMVSLAENLGIDPLFIEYLNNSIPHNNSKTVFQDLLSVRQLLNIMNQPGPSNDLYDYLLDANVTNTFQVGAQVDYSVWNGTHWVNYTDPFSFNGTGWENTSQLIDVTASYFETAQVIDANTLQVSRDGVKDVLLIINGTQNATDGRWINPFSWWDVFHTDKSFNDYGRIFVNTSQWGDSFLQSDPIQVLYTTNKLHLLDLSNIFGAILNMTFGTGEEGAGGEGGGTSDLLADIFAYLPGALYEMGIDFDRIMPELIRYLKINISQPEPVGFGIKPFELMDVAYHALFSGDGGDDSVEAADDLLSGSSRDLIDNIIKEVVAKFIEQADPFQLAHAAINDLTPIMDYLNRSRIFSREVLIPLIVGMFPSGTELSTLSGESVSLEEIVDIIMPLITEMIVGGDLAHFDHEALNPFAWLSAPECVEYHYDMDYQDLKDRGYSLYQIGMGNWTPDYPKYDNLRLMSNLSLGLLLSGFGADDLWALINQLGLIDLGGGDGDGSSDPFAGLKGLLSLLGIFVPSTEWDSLLRELGIWSCWEGDFQQFDLDIGLNIGLFGWSTTIPFYFNLRDLMEGMVNMEQLLATGRVLGGEFVQLCLYENQSYGNPYAYFLGYDTSYNTGPYRDMIGIAPNGPCDNWGWAPRNWDPGGYLYGNPSANYSPPGGAKYEKSFIAEVISTVPAELDLNVIDLDPIGIPFSFNVLDLWGILTVTADLFITLTFSPEIFMRIRLEGNPSQLMHLFEEQGIPIFGLGAHFVGGDLAGLVTDLVDSLTNPAGAGGGGANETFEFPELDLVILLQSFLNSEIDIMHYWKYLVDPEFMKAEDWWLDPGYVDINATSPTLIWDNDPNIPGDGDGIPDEYPWYRFEIPIYNQINPDLGPATTAGRNPALLDHLTPIGPPGSGLFDESEEGDDIPDGIQHYWYDTPYAYVNTTVDITDPWLYVNPYAWNDYPPATFWQYTVPGIGLYTYGDDADEKLPLLRTDPDGGAGTGISWSAWDATGIPSLYFVPSGTSPGVVGSATYYPLPQPPGTGADRYPNIWNAFNITLNQTDYRFGYWTQKYDPILDKTYRYLETKPFYDLLSYAFYPQLMDLLDWTAPLITDLILDLIAPSGSDGGGGGVYQGDFGIDYYHDIRHSDVYSKFGMGASQPLCPIGMLQWLWDGAGMRWNGTHSVPYIEPYTVPDLQGALDWLADHGFTLDFIIKNLNKIFDMLSTEDGGGGGLTEGAVDLAGDLASILSVETITNLINSIEDYMRIVVAQNETTGLPDRRKATEMALQMLKDMTKILDIYPIKAIRGALNYLMPRLFESRDGGTGDGGSSLDVNQLDLGTFLEQSGILDLIFVDKSKLSNLNFNLSIHQSTIDFYLFGQLIEDVPLDFEFQFDLASLFGDSDSDGGGSGEPSGTDMLNNLPIAFPGGFPYMELSTFNGPFDITFQLYNISPSGGRTPVNNTEVTIGEVWYNETTGVYYFNRTQSSYEFGNGIWGWTDLEINGTERTYIRPNSLLRSNASGMVDYSSVIEEDAFGWVESYIYIHVEEPSEYTDPFYWWNVTGHPRQRTLAGNTPPYKARWIEDGSDIRVQTKEKPLPPDVINIDNDSYWEIFARVEIDGYKMPIHDVVYVREGSVNNVNASSLAGSTSVQINSSFTTATTKWNVFALRDQTKYITQEELTPTGKTVSYPTISQVISGVHLRAENWTDDSIYKLRLDYVNLSGALLNLFNWELPIKATNSSSYTYDGGAAPTGFSYSIPAGAKSLFIDFSPPSAAGLNDRYAQVDIEATDFYNKTIRSVQIDLTVTRTPDVSGTEYPTLLYEDLGYTRPIVDRTYFFTEDISTSEFQIAGSPGNLNTKDATTAWFNYTLPIPNSGFLNGIDWYIMADETASGSSNTSQVAEVIIEYYNESDSSWWRLWRRTPNSKSYEPEDEGGAYLGSGYLHNWGDLSSNINHPHQGGVIISNHDLYLTARGHDHSHSLVFENVTQIKFMVRITENPAVTDDGIGYINGTPSYLTNGWVKFKFYPFVNQWGSDIIELPEGFVDDFDISVEMYDPLGKIDADLLADGTADPTLSVSYVEMGPMTSDITYDYATGGGTRFFASKVLVYLESWDSLVRAGGDHGDILFQDNRTIGTDRLVELTGTPSLNVTLDIIDLEARVFINVTIDADQTLRKYYLRFNITPGLGYEGVGYTNNYRFSIGSSSISGPNSDALRKIGAYPAKKVLIRNALLLPISLQVGITDLEVFPDQYTLLYILTFEVSPQFLLNDTAIERFLFAAVWEKANGTYEIFDEKNVVEAPAAISIKYA